MITPQDSIAIRQMYSTGNYTKTSLAKLFGCCPDTITNVLNRSADKDIYVRNTNPDNLLIMPYKDLIREWLSKSDLKIQNVYQKLMDLGATLSLSTVSRAVKSTKRDLDLLAIRYETTPGQQGQVDWSSFPGYKATVDGVEKPLYALFLILGYSRTKYVEFTTDMTCETLIRCIENGLRYYGGTPKELLFDNMPQVVNRCLRNGNTHSLERELVPEFTNFADYCGFDIVLSRIRRPQEKGKVERFVAHFKNGLIPLLEKKTGHDLVDLNKRALAWCNKVNQEIHRTTNERPIDRLSEEGLTPLPEIPYYNYDLINVQRDGTVYFRGFVYSVDPKYEGCEGKVIQRRNSLIVIINNNIVLLGKRKLPVYTRKRYSRTKQCIKKHPRRKHIRTSSLKRWVSCDRSLYGPITVTPQFIKKHFNKTISPVNTYNIQGGKRLIIGEVYS